MSTALLEILPFALRTASERDYGRLNAFMDVLNAEAWPDDPPVPLSERIELWRSLPEFQQEAAWTIWDEPGEQVVAYAEAAIWHTGANEHLAEFIIQVLPEYRQRGLARRLLAPILEFARTHQRRLLLCESVDRVPAAAAFLTCLGAHPGLAAHINQLRLAELDRALIERWLAQARPLAVELELGWWTGAYPEAYIAAIADLIEETAKDEPHDELDVEDQKFAPDTLRQWEQHMFAAGSTRWTAYLLNRADRQLVGLTETLWSPSRPTIGEQMFTGVRPPFRGRGLGRWLKAAMADRILRERPAAEIIRTGNADSNAPMRRINLEMGFRPYVAESVWQIETEAVAAYLATRTPSTPGGTASASPL